MLETITKKVAPQSEQHTIEIMGAFGWRLKSSQEINVQDSHLENRSGTIYSVTTKENYIKLLFERETNTPNYKKIISLENEYYQILNEKPTMSKIISGVLLFAGFLVSGLLWGFLLGQLFENIGSEWSFFTAIIPFVVYLILHRRKYKKWDKMASERIPQILSTSRKLLMR